MEVKPASRGTVFVAFLVGELKQRRDLCRREIKQHDVLKSCDRRTRCKE